jgi:hypothetical protein
MSFGWSFGDLSSLTNLAWNLYKECKVAAVTLDGFEQELQLFEDVLSELERRVLGDDQRSFHTSNRRAGNRTTQGKTIAGLIDEFRINLLSLKKTSEIYRTESEIPR